MASGSIAVRAASPGGHEGVARDAASARAANMGLSYDSCEESGGSGSLRECPP